MLTGISVNDGLCFSFEPKIYGLLRYSPLLHIHDFKIRAPFSGMSIFFLFSKKHTY